MMWIVYVLLGLLGLIVLLLGIAVLRTLLGGAQGIDLSARPGPGAGGALCAGPLPHGAV